MKCMRIIPVVLIVIFTSINVSATTNYCMRCYEQKQTEWGQCITHPEMAYLYPHWCAKEMQAAKAMYSVAPEADKILNSPLLKGNKGTHYWTVLRKSAKPRIPFNYCDACINNMTFLEMQCASKQPVPAPQKICKNPYLKFFLDVRLAVLYHNNPSFVVQNVP